jgi:hypothetical protein
MHTRKARIGYAASVAALLALALGVTGAIGAGKFSGMSGGGATAKTSAKGISKSKVKSLIKAEVKKQLKGKTGPAGPAGPAGPSGPAGPTIGIPIKKLAFRANKGTGLQIPYDGPGMKLEANCLDGNFQLTFRAEEAGGLVHAFASGTGGTLYSGGGVADTNSALDLVPESPIVSGKLEYSAKTGETVTVNYMAVYGTGQADCVFTGTIAETGKT